MKKINYLVIFTLILFAPKVFACDKQQLINDNYDYLTGIYPEFVLEEKTCEEIQKIIDNNYVLKHTSMIDDNGEFAPRISGFYETSSKRIELSYFEGGSDPLVTLSNEWKKIPAFRGNDIIALRFTGPTYYSGTVDSYFQYSNSTTSYRDYGNYSSSNATTASNGVGFVYKLPAGDLESLYFFISLDCTSASGTIAGAYQHATSGVSLANAKNYTFSAAGLGGVIYHSSSTVRSAYDGMSGTSIQV